MKTSTTLKKDQSEMTDILNEIIIYMESTVELMKPRLRLVIWNIRKPKAPN